MIREQDKPNPFNHPEFYEAERLRKSTKLLEFKLNSLRMWRDEWAGMGSSEAWKEFDKIMAW